MTRDEFVELHGDALWESLVAPAQKLAPIDSPIKHNANIIIHNDFLMPLLRKICPTAKGFKEVKMS